MKNLLSALFLFSLLGSAIVGIWLLAGFDSEEVQLSLEEVAIEVEQKLGQPFLEAWKDRDVKRLKGFMRGEFDASAPIEDQWTIELKPPFEHKTRTCRDEEERESVEKDDFLGLLLDQTSRLEFVQSEFSVIEIRDDGDGYWFCRVLLTVIGKDEDSYLKKYESEHGVNVEFDPDTQERIPWFYNWEVFRELVIKSQRPIWKELESSLKLTSADSKSCECVFDIADYDQDQDTDVFFQLEDGGVKTQALLAFEDGNYENVTQQVGLPTAVADPNSPLRVNWMDIDKDGYPELILTTSSYRNEQGTKFVDATEQYGPRQRESLSHVRRRLFPSKK